MESLFEKLILVKLECSNSTYKAEARGHILYGRTLLFAKVKKYPVKGFIMPLSDSDVFVRLILLGNV